MADEDRQGEDEGPSSPPIDPHATGQRKDHRNTVPGEELPNAPERGEVDPDAGFDADSPPDDSVDTDAAQERGDE